MVIDGGFSWCRDVAPGMVIAPPRVGSGLFDYKSFAALFCFP